MDRSHWVESVRPEFSDTIETPLHSRHMELKCHWTNYEGVQKDPMHMEEGHVPGHVPLVTVYVSVIQRKNDNECLHKRATMHELG
jgi:hypothetical protein